MKGNMKRKILIMGAFTILFSLIIFSFTMQANGAEEVTVVCSWDVSADDGKSNVSATLYNDGSFIISGQGEMKDYSSILDVPYLDSLFKVKKVKFENGVTRIGECSFSECSTLTSIEISNSVKSIGKDAFYLCNGLSNVDMGNGIISIEDFAFFGCDSLISINIPDCTVYMGYRPFSYCMNLTSINVDENNKNYSSEDGVLFNKDKTILMCYPSGKQTEVYNVPNSVISIGQVVFDRCNALEKIVISSSVLDIHWNAFSDTYLKNIEVDENNKNYSSEDGVLFNKDKTILMCYPPRKEQEQYNIISSVEAINDTAFKNCIILENIKIPSSVTEINSWAFEGCSRLINIKIPSSVTEIGVWAFNGCNSLKSIEVDENNTKYSSESGVLFNKDKTELIRYPAGKKEEKYEIPTSVAEISIDAFDGVEFWMIVEQNTNSMVLPELIKRAIDRNDILYSEDIVLKNCSIDENGENLLINTDKLQEGEYATIQINSGDLGGTKLYITNGVWDISKDCDKSVIATLSKDGVLTISGQGPMGNFYQAPYYKIREMINSIKISKGITSIGYSAFMQCSNLKSVNIPEGVTNIDYGAFYKCTSLTSINIPSSVVTIGNYAFDGCSRVTSIEIPSNVKFIGNYAFRGCKNIYINVNPGTTIEDRLNIIQSSGNIEVKKNNVTINNIGKKLETGMVIYESNIDTKFDVIVRGDLNGDGQIGNIDLLKIARYNAGIDRNLEGVYLKAADIYKDGVCGDNKDLLKIARVLAGLENL